MLLAGPSFMMFHWLLLLIIPFVSSSVVRRHNQPYSQRRFDVNTTTPSHSDSSCSFWLEDLVHQGIAPFQNDSSYQVFRNVKDYGAIGDGIADDTAAINRAISDGNRCAPGSCASTTTTPALVYFPAGTYLISGDIIDYYLTHSLW